MDPTLVSTHENAERILRAGWELFHKNGYRGTSVDELCQRCNLTKPTLYYYFQNKENLYVQVLLYRLRGLHQLIEQKGALSQRLKRFVDALSDSHTLDIPVMLREMHHIHESRYRRQLKVALQSEILQPLGHLMQEGIDAGELAPKDPMLYSRIFLGMISLLVANPRDLPLDSRTLAEELVQFFLKGASGT